MDLNSFLCRNARVLSRFHAFLGNSSQALAYAEIGDRFQEAIDRVLWDEEAGAWFDYDMQNQRQRRHFLVSSATPLWAECYP